MPLATLLLVILASVLSLLLLAYIGYLMWRFWKGLDTLEIKDRFAIKNDFIKTTAQILGGAFFILLRPLLTWQNLVLTQEKYRADSFIAQEKQTTDLFTAIEQLGSDKLEVRLGGIYHPPGTYRRD